MWLTREELDQAKKALQQRTDTCLMKFCGGSLPYGWGLIVVLDTNIVHCWNLYPNGSGYGYFFKMIDRIKASVDGVAIKIFIPATVSYELNHQKDHCIHHISETFFVFISFIGY